MRSVIVAFISLVIVWPLLTLPAVVWSKGGPSACSLLGTQAGSIEHLAWPFPKQTCMILVAVHSRPETRHLSLSFSRAGYFTLMVVLFWILLWFGCLATIFLPLWESREVRFCNCAYVATCHAPGASQARGWGCAACLLLGEWHSAQLHARAAQHLPL